MKYLFVCCLLLLVVAGVITARSAPELQTKRPIIYWVTDPNPARVQQIELFHKWLVKNGHVAPNGEPAVELRLDTANNDISKKIIQCVSGVGGDVLDLYGGGQTRYFQTMGVLQAVTEDARRMGFDPSHTYPAMAPEIVVDGKQYTFPCNVTAHGYFVNGAVFEKYGIDPPPRRWTFDEFERIGRRLAAAANTPGKPRADYTFITGEMYPPVLYRSLGLDRFNETMTRCTLDDPRYVEVLQRMYDWTFKYNIMPRPEDSDAMANQASGYGGSSLQLFNKGQFALIHGGRYLLIQLREFNTERKKYGEPLLDMSVSEPPHGGFPNASADARAAGLYVDSKNKEMATLFLAFLASEDYNMQIVEDADSLPPNPQYTKSEAYLRPPKYPEEWEVHSGFLDLAETIGIARSYSPFVLTVVADRIENNLRSSLMSRRYTAAGAAHWTGRLINEEIERRLVEEPSLAELHRTLTPVQASIDAIAEGQIIPHDLRQHVTNPFYQRYYAARGWMK